MISYTYNPLELLGTVYHSVSWSPVQERSFVYDTVGRLTKARIPEMGPASTSSGDINYKYYDDGMLKERSDVRGVIAYNYDHQKRLTTKTLGGALRELRCYEGKVANAGGTACVDPAIAKTFPKRRLTGVGNSVSRTEFEYDQLGRVKTRQQLTSGVEASFIYQYNYADGLTQITYPAGRVVGYGYNGRGLVASVGSYATGINYKLSGALKSWSYGNTLVRNNTYNARMQPVTMKATRAPFDLLSLTYAYPGGNNGNIQSITEAIADTDHSGNWTQGFTYDASNRLSTAIEGGGYNQNYVYDSLGNRAVLSSGTILDSNQTPQVPSVSAEVPYRCATPPCSNPRKNRWIGATYDDAGRMTASASGVRTYAYDEEDRITSVSGAGSATFGYDAEGRRVTKMVSGQTTVYVYDAMGNLAEERQGPRAVDCQTCYLSADHLGSTRLITSQSGAVVERYDYLPFGESIYAGNLGRTAAMKFPAAPSAMHQFTGKERDVEASLDYFLGAPLQWRPRAVHQSRSRECGFRPLRSTELAYVRLRAKQPSEVCGPRWPRLPCEGIQLWHGGR